MNSVLDKLESRITGLRRPDTWSQPAAMDLHVSETGEIRPQKYCDQMEHLLTLRFKVAYWANPAQEIDARKAAARVLLDCLYQPIRPLLAQLYSACYAGSREHALQLCDDITREITGE